MRAGRLDRVITILRRAPEHDVVADDGTVTRAAGSLISELRVRAELVSIDTVEASETYGHAETLVVTLRTRYLAGLTADDSLEFEGATYNIRSIAEIGRRRGLELRVERAR